MTNTLHYFAKVIIENISKKKIVTKQSNNSVQKYFWVTKDKVMMPHQLVSSVILYANLSQSHNERKK